MKSLWNIVCVLAIANLIGLAGFAGWLSATDRLSVERLRRVREILAPTNADDAAKVTETAATEEKAAKEAAETKRMEGPPESASDRIERQASADDAKAQAKVRGEREIADLRRTLMQERADLDHARAVLAAERKKFEETRAMLEKQNADEQFQQALGALESQKPKDAFGVLKTLLDGPRSDQAIAYLAAMGERSRSKIMAEAIKADEKLATSLLERIRVWGVTAPPVPSPQATAPAGTPAGDEKGAGPPALPLPSGSP